MEEARTQVPLADRGTFKPSDEGPALRDPLGFEGYQKAWDAQESPWGESVAAGPAAIGGHPVELALFDFSFFGGSMGEIAGERLSLAMERAARRRVPFVLRTSTGGARMQEGMAALVQMPKVVAARMAMGRSHVPFVAVLGHPTTGGVLASVGALADLTYAEAGATIGFAGPRVVESFTGKAPGRTSHKASTALKSGLVDDEVSPAEVAGRIATFLDILKATGRSLIPSPPTNSPVASASGGSTGAPVGSASGGSTGAPVGSASGGSTYGGRIEPWDAVRAARDPARPRGRALVEAMSEGTLVELRGDRQGVDDEAVMTAITRVGERKMLVIALEHGHSPTPSGFRKARRALEIAGRLGLPVATLVDTAGADPSPASENAGIAWEIARLFEAMLTAPVPVIAVVTGEGGSGGALAFATADRLLIYRDATFSVIGPEAAAQILWRDPSRAAEAATLQALTAHDLRGLGIADEVVEDTLTPEGLASVLAYHLARLEDERPGGDWGRSRQNRWRKPRGKQE